MRISTNMQFGSGIASMNRQFVQSRASATADRRPTGATRPTIRWRRAALEVQRAADISAQFRTNHGSARSTLELGETQLDSATEL